MIIVNILSVYTILCFSDGRFDSNSLFTVYEDDETLSKEKEENDDEGRDNGSTFIPLFPDFSKLIC